jgi:hypothetical protein
LYAPTSSTQNLKLKERWTIPLYSNIPTNVEALSSLRHGIGASSTYILFNYANQDSDSRPLALIPYKLHAPTSSNQKLKVIGRREQFTHIPTYQIISIEHL